MYLVFYVDKYVPFFLEEQLFYESKQNRIGIQARAWDEDLLTNGVMQEISQRGRLSRAEKLTGSDDHVTPT